MGRKFDLHNPKNELMTKRYTSSDSDAELIEIPEIEIAECKGCYFENNKDCAKERTKFNIPAECFSKKIIYIETPGKKKIS